MQQLPFALAACLRVVSQWVPTPSYNDFAPAFCIFLGLGGAAVAAVGLGIFLVLVCLAVKIERESSQRL